MKFKQDKESNITFIGYDTKTHDFPDPEVGKTYKAFDDSKIRRSRLMLWKITKAINLDTDKVSKALLKLLSAEIYNCHWVYKPEQTIIYRAKAVNEDGSYDKDVGYCYFLKTKSEEWFGVGCGWWGSVLDTDDYYYNSMLKQEAETEREEKFSNEAIDVLASVFPEIKKVEWYGQFLKDLSEEDYELAKKTLEVQYGVTLNAKRLKWLKDYKWDLIDQFYYTIYSNKDDNGDLF